MRILVTGGTTFVSRYTAQYFIELGHDVYVLNRNTKPQVKGVKLIEADRNAIGTHYREFILMRYWILLLMIRRTLLIYKMLFILSGLIS